MSEADPFSAYLELADKVFKREVKLNALSAFISTLPPLDRDLLERLAEESEKASLSQPRMSWAICCVAEKASRQQKLDLFTRSLAAWYLGRAANRWVQPQKIAKAIARARRGFVKLGDAGWVAACDWMANDLPWASGNLLESENILSITIATIKSTNCRKFLPHILLALAQIHILLENFSEAENNISESEIFFTKRRDNLNLARCWLVRGNCLRRTSQFDKANEYLHNSEKEFYKYSAISDLGKLYFFHGIIYLYGTTDFEQTSEKFQNAIKIFSEINLDIWKGMSLTYLGVTCMQIGQLNQASILYQKAYNLLKHYFVDSLLAENYTASAKLNIFLGQSNNSLIQSLKAREIHTRMGRAYLVGIDNINIGEAFYQLGRYQDALHEFELAFDILKSINEKVRIGLLQINLADFWINLKEFKLANQLLALAELNGTISNQLDTLIKINNSRALIQFELKNPEKAHHYLTISLELAQKANLVPQIALTTLNLGNFYLANKNYMEALSYFLDALFIFEIMGMTYEKIFCNILMGTCNKGINQIKQAKNFYIEALRLSSNFFEDLNWRAYTGLAELHEPIEALHYYHKAVNSLNEIRETFWQPDLAGSYSQTPGQMVAKAVKLAATHAPFEEVLFFIEADKAVSLQQQFNLTKQPTHGPLSDKLAEEKAEMRWLKQQIQSISMSNNTLQADPRIQELQTKLRAKKAHCDELMAQLDRRQTGVSTNFQQREFSLENFQQMLNKRIGSNWASINYYQLEDQIVSVLITPDASQTLITPLTPRLKKALRVCQQSHQNSSMPSESDLRILGECLIPAAVQACLTPETTLLIVPHQSLHGIPWAAIGEAPLVTQCLPMIAPSLKSLALIWEHNVQNELPHPRKGLLAGAAHFEGRYPDLPAVEEELAALQTASNNQMMRRIENTATYEELRRSLGDTDQLPFDCLHLSTHFFSDQESGRLSGIALQSEDIWVDQLRDLAPLPSLVTFSGCNSLFGQVYAGDEQISLPNTCFLAGAANVIGSVWPVLDRSTIPIMSRLYKHFLSGISPVKALSLAQRESIQLREGLRSWAGFCCLGIP